MSNHQKQEQKDLEQNKKKFKLRNIKIKSQSTHRVNT